MKIFYPIFLIGLLACQNEKKIEISEESLSIKEQVYYLNKGKEIAQSSASLLSRELMGAMSQGGVPSALAYCNLNAVQFLDSLSKHYDLQVRRTSLKARNPDDEPDEIEKIFLADYQATHEKGGELEAKATLLNNQSVLFTAPIMVNMLCLKCHGEIGEDLKEENYSLIKEMYPNDQATGYKVGDFRGMWSILFSQKK